MRRQVLRMDGSGRLGNVASRMRSRCVRWMRRISWRRRRCVGRTRRRCIGWARRRCLGVRLGCCSIGRWMIGGASLFGRYDPGAAERSWFNGSRDRWLASADVSKGTHGSPHPRSGCVHCSYGGGDGGAGLSRSSLSGAIHRSLLCAWSAGDAPPATRDEWRAALRTGLGATTGYALPCAGWSTVVCGTTSGPHTRMASDQMEL